MSCSWSSLKRPALDAHRIDALAGGLAPSAASGLPPRPCPLINLIQAVQPVMPSLRLPTPTTLPHPASFLSPLFLPTCCPPFTPNCGLPGPTVAPFRICTCPIVHRPVPRPPPAHIEMEVTLSRHAALTSPRFSVSGESRHLDTDKRHYLLPLPCAIRLAPSCRQLRLVASEPSQPV